MCLPRLCLGARSGLWNSMLETRCYLLTPVRLRLSWCLSLHAPDISIFEAALAREALPEYTKSTELGGWGGVREAQARMGTEGRPCI